MVSGSSASPVATGTGVPETKAARATPPLQRMPGVSGVAGSLGRLGRWVLGRWLSGFSHNASPTAPSPAFRNGSRERPQGSLQSRLAKLDSLDLPLFVLDSRSHGAPGTTSWGPLPIAIHQPSAPSSSHVSTPAPANPTQAHPNEIILSH
ncbi:hypothetical protein AUP68_09767 [Ilyonectria robusta]